MHFYFLTLLYLPMILGTPIEHVDPTLPPALISKPTCSLLILQQRFADTVNSPPASANFFQPPACPAPWTRIVLELSASASDVQKHRIAAVWIDGAEILRTSTPLPMASDTTWRVQKDITRYTALLTRVGQPGGNRGIFTMMLKNSNATLPGVYSVNLTLHFYRGAAVSDVPRRLGYASHPSVTRLYSEPADLIIPLSQEIGYGNSRGFWFRIDNALHVPTKIVAVPRNAYRAVIEIFSSYHAADELWYTNPYYASHIGTEFGAGAGNGGFRQVYATVDGRFVGSHIPYAIIYPSSINPYFWSPVAAIGAFDMPSYDIDITPFLGGLLDGLPHVFGLGVRDSQSYWLLTANLHVWTDAWSDTVEGNLVEYVAPQPKINYQAGWGAGDGQSEIVAEGMVRFSGWVSSSKGNLTTTVYQKMKFKSQVQVQNQAVVRQVDMMNKERMTVEVSIGNQMVRRVELLLEAPLQIQTWSANADSMDGGGSQVLIRRMRMHHELREMVILDENQVSTTSTLTDRQDAEGSAVMQGDSTAIWGSGDTKSIYKYRDQNTCYLRNMNTVQGVVITDDSTPSCYGFADI